MNLPFLRQLGIVFAVGSALTQASCNQPGCDGLHAPSEAPTAPVLLQVELVTQRPENPWAMIFAVSFRDSDGDMGDGVIDVFSGANTPAQIAVKSFVEASALEKAATSGRFGLPLTLAQGGVPDDTTLRLGFQLRDRAGQFSNCYSIEIHFDVMAVDSAHGQTPVGQDPLTGLALTAGKERPESLRLRSWAPIACDDVASYGWSAR